MKKKVLLSSIATIALCLCLIAGSTFALFTSTSENNIAVTAAKVEMTADITNLTLASVRPATVAEVRAAADGGDITIIEDEFGGQYVYADRADGTFANGGTADFKDAVLTLDRITPGDKVSFDVVGANTSDVTIQYRYVIECMEGKELMSGLLISVEGVTYEFLGSYTSAWATLTPGTNITPVPVVIEFPVTAGNEFQELSTSIKVTVEAVQGNADVEGSKPVIEFLDGIAVDLAGRALPINAGVVNTGNLELSNGSIVIDAVGFENIGNATLNNVVIEGGTSGTIAYGYGVISGANSVTVLNDVTVNSANGAIGVTNGGNLTFNDGYVEVDSKSTSGRYLFYVVGEGSVATINDGTFYFNKTQNQKRAYAYVGAGATLYINGGNFGTASSRSGYTAGILNDGGTVVITGGSFGFDPSDWVADGYQVVKNGTNWYVVPENVDAVVSTVDQLQAALDAAQDDYVINVVADIAGDVVAAQKPNTTVTINGNGKTFAGVLLVDGKSGTYTTAGLTIKNLVFKADSISADACIQLGKDNNTRYTCNVTVSGCTFDVPGAVGIKSYTGGDKNLKIVDCTATERAHSLAQLKGIDGVLVENCTVNAVRGINLNNSNNVVIKDSTFDVEKYAVRFGESANSTVENFAVTNCTLTSDCAEGDAVIVLRAGATNANLDLSGTTLNGSIEMKGHENANIVR